MIDQDDDHGTFEVTVPALSSARETYRQLVNDRDRDMTELLDTTVTTNEQGTTKEIIRLYRVGGPGTGHQQSRVRISVHRDFYTHQSFATAEVWSEIGTWTLLLSEPPERWHHDTPNYKALRPATVAAQLLNRAIHALTGD